MRYLIHHARAAVAALILVFSFSASAAVSAQTAYDAVNDFSITSSTGVWSYGYTATRGSQLVPYNNARVDASEYNGLGVDIWNLVNTGNNPPLVGHNRSGELRIYSTVRHPADLLNLHPGQFGEQSVVRWTAPVAGLYQIKGRFQGIDVNHGGTDVSVLYNSATKLFADFISGFDDQKEFAILAHVETGETIDFSVGYGRNENYANDSTGLSATIRPFGISGRVTDECGQGLGGVEVVLTAPPPQRVLTTTTDASGKYGFALTRVGRSYTVSVPVDRERSNFRYEPESYTFPAMNEPQTANFTRVTTECPPRTVCKDVQPPPCTLQQR